MKHGVNSRITASSMVDSTHTVGASQYARISGVRELADKYDALLVDSYGVLHDGESLYPGSAECLENLRSKGRTVVILTNTPRRARTVAREIEKVGIAPRRHYDFLVSAGEVTFRMLSTRREELGLAVDDVIYYVGPPRSRELLDGISFAEATTIGRASVMLITGLFPGMDEVGDYDQLLSDARGRNLPAICANPDLVAIRSGIRGGCAGTVAAEYQKLGGTVRYFGKPFPEIYEMALDALQGTDRSRVLCVGDALHTDVGGARNVGLDCLFVSGGIHQGEIGASMLPDPVASLFHLNQVFPTASIDRFQW
jgi:HAD superfamily hydrolase (TIGR01459 family)